MRKHKLITALSMIALIGISSLVWMGTAGTDARLVRTQYYHTYATGAAALDFEIDNSLNIQIVEVRLTLDTAYATPETIIVALDAGLGAAYDTTFTTNSLAGDTTWYWAPGLDVGPILGVDDKFKVDWANTGTKTYGLEVIWRKFY